MPGQTQKLEHRLVVWTGLGAAILLDTVAQLIWKISVMRLPLESGMVAGIQTFIREPIVWILIVLILAQFLNWMMVLARSDLSYSQPITGLSLVTVTAASTLYLHEPFGFMRGCALVLILAGVCLIGVTPVQTKQETRGPSAKGGGE